jgi:cysteine desulfurase
MSGGHHEFDLRPGTENIPAITGFAKASELKVPIAKIKNLRNYMIKELLKIKGSWINGSIKKRLCNNINISFKAIEGESLVLHLSRKGIAASTGSACSSKSLEPSHVLLATGLKPEDCHGSLRLTLSKYTTKSDVDYAVREIKKAVEQLRKISPFAHSVR